MELEANKKEITKEYNKKYYEKNREKHLNNLKQKIYCDCCHVEISKVNINKHNQTKKHQLLKNFENESTGINERLRIVKPK